MQKTRLVWSALAGLAVLGGGSMAQAAPQQFASFMQLPNDTAKSFAFVNNNATGAGKAGTFSYIGNNNVSFSFTGVSGVPSGPYTASVTFTGISTTAATQTTIPGFGNYDSEGIDTASITFTDTVSGKTLLSASFNGSVGGFDGGFSVSISSNSVSYSSDYLNFSGTMVRALTFQFNPTDVPTSIASNGLLSSFAGTGSGQFSSDPPPVSATGVPEPASLAMMGLGLAGLPLLARARRRKAIAA